MFMMEIPVLAKYLYAETDSRRFENVVAFTLWGHYVFGLSAIRRSVRPTDRYPGDRLTNWLYSLGLHKVVMEISSYYLNTYTYNREIWFLIH